MPQVGWHHDRVHDHSDADKVDRENLGDRPCWASKVEHVNADEGGEDEEEVGDGEAAWLSSNSSGAIWDWVH